MDFHDIFEGYLKKLCENIDNTTNYGPDLLKRAK